MNRKFSGYILAGGRSSRMGRDKAFLELNGETFLGRAAAALKSVCENPVKVVLNPLQKHFVEKLPAGTEPLFDVFENRGALGGIHRALADCPTDYAVVLACDLPLVTAGALRKLTSAAVARAGQQREAFVPRQTDGRLQPLCAVYRASQCLSKLEKYLAENSADRVRDFLDLVDAEIVEAIFLSDDEKLLFNVNRPADLEAVAGDEAFRVIKKS